MGHLSVIGHTACITLCVSYNACGFNGALVYMGHMVHIMLYGLYHVCGLSGTLSVCGSYGVYHVIWVISCLWVKWGT